jgi:hypothetical protein
MKKERNNYLRSLLTKSLDDLQLLEDNRELLLSFSHGICQLMQKTGGALPLLTAVQNYKIKRETDPFNDHSGGMFTYGNATIFFKISHQQNTAYIDIGLYNEIKIMRRQRDKYVWFSLKAIADF